MNSARSLAGALCFLAIIAFWTAATRLRGEAGTGALIDLPYAEIWNFLNLKIVRALVW